MDHPPNSRMSFPPPVGERTLFNCCQVHLNPESICGLAHFSDFSFWQFRVQTVATAMNATGRVQITPHRTHTRALLLAAHTMCDLHVWLKVLTILCVSRKVISSLVMSLLNVPSTPFPLVFSPSTTTPTPLTGIRLNPRATPLWGGPSGHLADPTPSTGYEPKICIEVASTRRSTFRPETWVSSNSTTRQSPLSMTSIYLNIPEHHAAASTQQQVQFLLC